MDYMDIRFERDGGVKDGLKVFSVFDWMVVFFSKIEVISYRRRS